MEFGAFLYGCGFKRAGSQEGPHPPFTAIDAFSSVRVVADFPALEFPVSGVMLGVAVSIPISSLTFSLTQVSAILLGTSSLMFLLYTLLSS